MINCFCCYVIKSAGEIAKKVLLSVNWNTLLIEINFSQIRTLDIKREKVCAVCSYLLFVEQSSPLSLLILRKLYFWIVSLQIYSCRTLALKSTNNIFTWYVGNRSIFIKSLINYIADLILLYIKNQFLVGDNYLPFYIFTSIHLLVIYRFHLT